MPEMTDEEYAELQRKLKPGSKAYRDSLASAKRKIAIGKARKVWESKGDHTYVRICNLLSPVGIRLRHSEVDEFFTSGEGARGDKRCEKETTPSCK